MEEDYDNLNLSHWKASTNFAKRPVLDDYKKKKPISTMKCIFRVGIPDLTIFFDEKNLKKPVNEGECRQSLNILRDYGYNEGLL